MALPDRINGQVIDASFFNDIHALLNNLGNNTLEVSSDHIIDSNEYNVFLVDATLSDIAITLPDATMVTGLAYKIKCINFSFDVFVNTFGTQTIDGDTNYTFSMRNESTTLISDGANWYEI